MLLIFWKSLWDLVIFNLVIVTIIKWVLSACQEIANSLKS